MQKQSSLSVWLNYYFFRSDMFRTLCKALSHIITVTYYITYYHYDIFKLYKKWRVTKENLPATNVNRR